MSALVAEFVSESVENLDLVDKDFIALEKRPGDREILARIFRAIHTLKGSCGFLGFSQLEALAHSAESLLGMLRDGALALSPAITTALLRTMDGVRAALLVIEKTGEEDPSGHAELIAQLDAMRSGTEPPPVATKVMPRPAVPVAQPAPVAPPPLATEVAMPPWADRVESLRRAMVDLDHALVGINDPEVPLPPIARAFSALARAARGFDVIVEVASKAAKHAAGADSPALRALFMDVAAFVDEALASLQATGVGPREVPPPLLELLDRAVVHEERPTPAAAPRAPAANPIPAKASAPEREPEPAIPSSAPASPSPSIEPGAGERSNEDGITRRGPSADSKIRVDVQLLDSLMNQVGELVLTRNQILQCLASRDGRVPGRITQRLSQITTDLQASIMRTRLQPMEIIWNRFPRTVRDLALELNKQVDLVMEGADTELDRSLLEAIRDPLTHLVRNAIDHGIEPESERVAAGKKPVGRLSLRAWHEGGQVNIEVLDDGRGIDIARLEKKAIERGLITAERARTMSQKEKIDLIFLPGFSTAQKITTVSGRGVGMDVVKHNVDQVNGEIEVKTEAGRGTAFRLKIPLTLAIVPALIVASAGERYVIPQVSLLAVVSLVAEYSERGIERVHNAAVFRWRGRLLPLVDLSATLGCGPKPLRGEAVTVVVLQAAERLFGLMVDAVVDSAEVVVKPVNRVITRTRVFAAATIMGDGRAAMILDVLGLAQRATVVTGRAEQAASNQALRDGKTASSSANEQALIVRVGRDLAVVPLSAAIRLEHFPAKVVEQLGRRQVAQYRGRMLPLQKLGGGEIAVSDPEDVLNVVVYTEEPHGLGLVVDELVDIIPLPKEIQKLADRAASVVGGTIVQNKVAQVLDLQALAREALS